MVFNVGDKVKVVSNNSSDPFVHLEVGTVTTISNIWENEEYPIELEGYSEHVTEFEIMKAEEDITEHDKE